MFKICIAVEDLAEWSERLAINANFATVLDSIPASSDTQMKQCWITYIKKIKSKTLFLLYWCTKFCLFNKNILPRPSLMTAFRWIPLSARSISLDNTFKLEEQEVVGLHVLHGPWRRQGRPRRRRRRSRRSRWKGPTCRSLWRWNRLPVGWLQQQKEVNLWLLLLRSFSLLCRIWQNWFWLALKCALCGLFVLFFAVF